jgi:hypothetical protein
VKVTEVSDGGGPEVSSTNTRATGRVLAADGVAGLSGAGTEGWRPLQARVELAVNTRSQVARLTGSRDIVPLGKVRSEK